MYILEAGVRYFLKDSFEAIAYYQSSASSFFGCWVWKLTYFQWHLDALENDNLVWNFLSFRCWFLIFCNIIVHSFSFLGWVAWEFVNQNAGHLSFIKDVAAAEPPKHLHYLLKVLQTRGSSESNLPPFDWWCVAHDTWGSPYFMLCGEDDFKYKA